MITTYYRRGPYGLGIGPSADDAAVQNAVEVIDDLSFSERAVFAAGADTLARWTTPVPTDTESQTPGVTATYATQVERNTRRIAFAFRVLGGVAAPLIAARFGRSKRSTLELAGWAAIGFFRPILGNAAAMVRGGS